MAKQPKECPNCNSPRITKILIGYPMFDEDLEKNISEGKIVLGGCCVTDDDPDYQCVECGAFIYSKSGKFYFDERDK